MFIGNSVTYFIIIITITYVLCTPMYLFYLMRAYLESSASHWSSLNPSIKVSFIHSTLLVVHNNTVCMYKHFIINMGSIRQFECNDTHLYNICHFNYEFVKSYQYISYINFISISISYHLISNHLISNHLLNQLIDLPFTVELVTTINHCCTR